MIEWPHLLKMNAERDYVLIPLEILDKLMLAFFEGDDCGLRDALLDLDSFKQHGEID